MVASDEKGIEQELKGDDLAVLTGSSSPSRRSNKRGAIFQLEELFLPSILSCCCVVMTRGNSKQVDSFICTDLTSTER